MSFPKLHTTDLAQQMFTPAEDAKKILQFVPKDKVIYECCWGDGSMAQAFHEEGYKVIGDSGVDFFTHQTNFLCGSQPVKYDVIITNPPWRNHKDFVEHALSLNKPFAFLLRLEHLGGVRAFDLFHDKKIQILIPKKRINYITPKMRKGEKVGGSPFHSIWLTYRLSLENDIQYIS